MDENTIPLRERQTLFEMTATWLHHIVGQTNYATGMTWHVEYPRSNCAGADMQQTMDWGY
jgi:hypothetical protein